MSNDMNTTVHYDLTGNAYYLRASSGFCGATGGQFTIARAEITCTDCLGRLS